jgi:heme exporter protein B
MFKAAIIIIKYDLYLAFCKSKAYLHPFTFAIIAVSLFPLAFDSSNLLLKQVFPGLLLITMLFSSMLLAPKLFEDGQEEGYLEQLLLSPFPPFVIVSSKIISHWIITSFPFLLMTPLVNILFLIPLTFSPQTIVTLFISSFIMSAIAIVGSILTYGIKHSNALNIIITMPFSIATMILASSAISSVISGHILVYWTCLKLLVAISLTFTPLIVYLGGFLLKYNS